MDVAALQATLDSLAAECVKRLGMRVETVEPGQVTLSLPVSAEIVHAGGVVCGQAILAAADTAMVGWAEGLRAKALTGGRADGSYIR